MAALLKVLFNPLVTAGLALAVLTSNVFAATPGTQYASRKIVFSDPLTGKTVWRMTTDGAQTGALHQAAGDQSSESRSFSPDSARIVYAKSGAAGAGKSDGIYLMDIQTGIETYLAPAPYYAAPLFARDGSGEVYYFERVSGTLVVRAVDTVTYQVRTVVTLSGASWQEKIEVNVDGSYVAAHPRMADGSYRTVIFTPQGGVQSNWSLSGPASDDGAQWSPTDPQWICATRNGQGKFWNISTLATKAAGCATGHSAWHPNGAWFFSTAYLTDIQTNADVLPGTGMEPIHPNINPAEGALGADARIIADDRNWFRNNTGRPRLSVRTLRELMADFDYTKGMVAVHYSSTVNNYAHPHAHWSWDGSYILWTSDVADLRDGTPPGGSGRGTDLFILPMGSASTTQQVVNPPVLSVNPASLAFSAVQGGAAPAAQSFAISNTGGGTMTWTVSDNAAWLSTSLTAGAGNATLSATTAPSGLAPGSYTGAVTVTSSGASGSPKTVAVTLTVTAPPTLSVSPTTLSFSAVQGGAAPAAQGFSISNTGGGTLAWSVSDNASWLSVSAASGSGNATLSVTIAPSGLAPGSYTGTITVTSSGVTGSPKTVAVTLTVNAPAPTSTTVTFDNPAPSGSSGSLLNGTFQGINFGSRKWRWEGAFNVGPTKHIYFNSSKGTSRTFSFATSPKILVGMRVFAVSAGTLTLTDNLGQRKVQTITTGSMQLVTTGWTQASTTVTVSFTRGWDLGVDDIEYRTP